jgi:deoxyguanosine kinase
MNPLPFITVEGAIGVGKTSLAKKLSHSLDYHFLAEIVEENPFLEKFYTNIDEWAFQTEMFFMSNRYKQLEDAEKNYLRNNQSVVSDYHIIKNLIFAEQTLSQNQWSKFQKIYQILTEDMPQPNVMVYLKASVPTLQEHIRMRNRGFEQNAIPDSYLEQLNIRYDKTIDAFHKTHPNVPVLEYNGDTIDFVQNPSDYEQILKDVQKITQI